MFRARGNGRRAGRKWMAIVALVPAAALSFQHSQSSPAGFFIDITDASGVRFVHQASPTSRKYNNRKLTV
jgi:hypothetical protein